MIFSSSLLLWLSLLFFGGKLARCKYGSVCQVNAEKEQQCLAAGIARRYLLRLRLL
ncbi:MAG: hypothetical protein K2O00_02700 [Muribaculaceae bacterium]|nr:hypothetical protein [Muribaculaceae bacterium]MDE7153341.1 hypothetical protein [Muribaculaceae bacterium]